MLAGTVRWHHTDVSDPVAANVLIAHAVEHFHALTRSIAIDHGRDGIRCNAIAPAGSRQALQTLRSVLPMTLMSGSVYTIDGGLTAQSPVS